MENKTIETINTANRGVTILVVEDDPDVLDIVVSHISLLGYRVLTARNGPEALAQVKSETAIHLIFSDFIMPKGMTGADLAVEAQRLNPDIKILLTSGYRFRSAAAAGANEISPFPILPKPYRQAELTAKIREMLRSSDDPASIPV